MNVKQTPHQAGTSHLGKNAVKVLNWGIFSSENASETCRLSPHSPWSSLPGTGWEDGSHADLKSPQECWPAARLISRPVWAQQQCQKFNGHWGQGQAQRLQSFCRWVSTQGKTTSPKVPIFVIISLDVSFELSGLTVVSLEYQGLFWAGLNLSLSVACQGLAWGAALVRVLGG